MRAALVADSVSLDCVTVTKVEPGLNACNWSLSRLKLRCTLTTPSPPRAGFLSSGASSAFGQIAYRLPTSPTNEKTLLRFK